MKKLYSVKVKGIEKAWLFNFYVDPKYLDDWRKDGLEIDEVLNVIPAWVVDAGIARAWIFFQDLFNFKFVDAIKKKFNRS